MTSKTKQKPEMTAHDEDGNEYNVEFMPISEIHPYANNPRENEAAVEPLTSRIDRMRKEFKVRL